MRTKKKIVISEFLWLSGYGHVLCAGRQEEQSSNDRELGVRLERVRTHHLADQVDARHHQRRVVLPFVGWPIFVVILASLFCASFSVEGLIQARRQPSR